MRALLLLLPALLLCSCASMLNTPRTSLRVSSYKGTSLVLGDSLCPLASIHPVQIAAPRSREPLTLILHNDSSEKQYRLRPVHAGNYWANVLNLGFGFLLDRHTVKKYRYPKRSFIDICGPEAVRYPYQPYKRGMAAFTLSFPLFNQAYLRFGKGDFTQGGTLGIGAGVQYWLAPRDFLSLQVSAHLTGGRFGERFYDTIGTWENEQILTCMVSARYNRSVGRFDFGAGISALSFDYRKERIVIDSIRGPEHRSVDRPHANLAVSSSFAAYYHLNKVVNFGLNYQPGLLSFGNNAGFRYQHLISFDVLLRFGPGKYWRKK